jgi:predicted dinucleotide-binding enzyme
MTTTREEREAVAAMQVAAQAITRASELAERAGFESLVLGPLADAQRHLRDALDTASGRN